LDGRSYLEQNALLKDINPNQFGQFNRNNDNGGTSYYTKMSVTNNEMVFEEAIERF